MSEESKTIINECSRCRMRGYEYANKEKKLCHLCVAREERKADPLLYDIFQKFVIELFLKNKPWFGCEHGKAAIYDAIVGSIKMYDVNFDENCYITKLKKGE